MGVIRNICNSCKVQFDVIIFLLPPGITTKKLYCICLPYFMSTSYADIFLLGIQLTISNLRLGSLTLIPRRLNSSKAVEWMGKYQWDFVGMETFVASLFTTVQKENQGDFWMLSSPLWPFNGNDNILMDERGSLSCNEMVCLHLSPLSSYHSPSQTRRAGLARKINFWWCMMTCLQTFRKMSSGKSLSQLKYVCLSLSYYHSPSQTTRVGLSR